MNRTKLKSIKFTPEQIFMASVILVNGGNYLYNLLLGRVLGPDDFADAAFQITLLLVLSFIGMTFQITSTKFAAEDDGQAADRKNKYLYKVALIIGIVNLIVNIIFAKQLRSFFNIESYLVFILVGFGIPIYFVMSVGRGIYQGKQKFITLSISYQVEMLCRLIVTFILLLLIGVKSSNAVAIGIFVSFGCGLIPTHYYPKIDKNIGGVDVAERKRIVDFMLITAGYELCQILINNSDILLVKHYFGNHDAGLYSALALIGRVVYFMAWMFVMLLLPKVIERQKKGESTVPILSKYVSFIGIGSIIMVICCAIFKNFIIQAMFGDEFISMSPLLWKYATATGLFAVSNIFAYYFISLEHYVPVIISGIFGTLQIVLIVLHHSSLSAVVHMQIIAMAILLVIQVGYFALKINTFKNTEIQNKED